MERMEVGIKIREARKQKDFTQERLDTFNRKESEETVDYAALAIEHIRTINKERGITNAESNFNHAV